MKHLQDEIAIDPATFGIRLIATADGIDTAEPSTNLIATIKAALAEQYSLNLATETRKGLIEAAKCGLHCGGTPPFGFRLGDDKRLEIDEYAAPAVRQIFAMYLADMGYTAILDWLADHNYHTAKGNTFTKGALNAILTNEKYAGVYVYDKTASKDENGMRNSHRYKDDYIRVEGGCPAIISQEDFERAQEKLRNCSEERHNYNSKHYYPLNGKVWDADNDVRYSGNTNHSNGHRYFQYRSAQSGVRSVRAEALEEAVFYAMRELLLSEKNMERLLPLLNEYADDIHEQSEQESIALKNKRTALESKLNHLLASIEQGNAPQSIVDRISELENEIETLDHQLDSAETAPQVFTLNDMKKLKKAFISYLQKHNTLEARHLIDNTIYTVQIGTDMIDIRFQDGITASRQTAAFFNNQI